MEYPTVRITLSRGLLFCTEGVHGAEGSGFTHEDLLAGKTISIESLN